MKVFRVFSEWFRDRSAEWLVVHKRGEYQYRNPDSAFIHRFGTFKTEADAREYLDQQIAPAERHEWRLYRLVPDE